MSAELTPERIAWLEGRMSSGNHTEYMADTVLALIAFWRSHESETKESETVPKLCRHCGMTLRDHRIIGNNCQGEGGWESSGWRSTVFESRPSPSLDDLYDIFNKDEPAE